MAGKETLLQSLVKPVVNALGFEFWGIQYSSQGRHTTVRIFIDSPEGINVDHCAEVSRQLGSVFDVEEPILGEYTLEVSSPGLDRPLFTLEQFKQFVGDNVHVRLRKAHDGRRKFTGRLKGVEGDEVVIAIDNDEYLLPYELIDKANVVSQP